MAAVVATEEIYTDDNITCVAVAAITAARFVKITGGHVGTPLGAVNIGISPCTAGAAAFGVAMHSAAVGELVAVRPISHGGVYGITAGTGGVTFGQEVESDATGQAVALSTGKVCGMAINTVAAAGVAEIAIGR